MRKYGLIGYPLEHSFSKAYFIEKFKRENITDCSYDNFPLQNLNSFHNLIKNNSDLCGLNVTIPYKTEILKYIDVICPEIQAIGAVNVLKIKKRSGKTEIHGYNSDIDGIKDSVVPHLSGSIKNALVLGTGGASMAVRHTLKKLGLNVTLVSRKAKEDAISYEQVSHEILQNSDIIINTTPLGMFPDNDTAPDIDYSLLTEKQILFDLVYNPEMTSFLTHGKEHGCTLITGKRMLHSQAERAWQIWNDPDL